MVNVAIVVVEKEDKILLIKRERGDFVGLWGLPGGKVEECEHIDEAAKREMKEELGLDLEFIELLGTSTEIMHDKNSTSILNICKLGMNKNQEIQNPEFQYKWFSKQEIKDSKEIIGSDKIFLEIFYNEKSSTYLKLDCYKDEKGEYYWK